MSKAELEDLVRAAYIALDSDDIPRAMELSQILINLRQARGFEILALALEKQERYEDGIEVLQKGVSVVPEAYPLWELMGNLYARSNDFEKAENAYSTALACPQADSASITYNLAVMLKNSGRHEQALYLASEVEAGHLATRLNVLQASLLNTLGRHEEAGELANFTISEIMSLEELADEDMKDLACVYAELGKAIYLGSGNKQAAFESAWKALEWERSEATALWLVRELIARKSPESRWFQLEVEGNWYFPLEQGKLPPRFRVTYEIVADNIEEAIMFAKHLEPPEIRESMQIKTVSDKGAHPANTQGLYWRSPYNFVLA